MGYGISIEKATSLTLEEWQKTVGSREDVRLRSEPHTAKNPRTGEVISVEAMPGDADLLLDGEWVPCFKWEKRDPDGGWPSAVAFDAPADFADAESRVRVVARELAKLLSARLVGEEGEEYD